MNTPAASTPDLTPRRPGLVRLYAPIGTAVVIALSSFATLAAYDAPLDRHSLMPSIIECNEVVAVDRSSDDASAAPGAHAVLLKFELQPQPQAKAELL